jgi:peptide/nickel transport system permease protein
MVLSERVLYTRAALKTIIGRRRLQVLAGHARVSWRRFRTEKTAVFGLAVVIFFTILALFPWLFAPYSPTSIAYGQLQSPSWAHPLGTDDIGRDVASRMVWGSRVSLLFGVMAAGLSLILGTVLGLLAGYYGGWVDQILSRFFEIILMIPAFFLLVVVVAIFGNNINFEILVVGITIWPANARVMRASVLSLKERQFVRAAVVTGASGRSIILRHILPNAIQPVIVNSSLQIGQAILFEAGMSFLGLSDPNVVTWGQLVNVGAFHLVDAWWLAFFPGIALGILILGFNLIGDGLGAVLGSTRALATREIPAEASP